jgi:hypothetical protein
MSAFIAGVVVCLWIVNPALAQKDPKPYDDSKPKKSSAKPDTTKTDEKSKSEKAKADTTKTKEKSKTKDGEKKKSEGEKPEAKADTAKTKEKSKTKDGEKKKSESKKPEAKADKKSEAETAKKKEGEAKKPQTGDEKAKQPEGKQTAPKTDDTAEAKSKTSRAGKPIASSHILRAMFTDAVVEREPASDVDSLTTDVDRVYFFTEIVDMQGKQVTHRWMHDGEVVAEVPFEIGGPRWRVYSSKRLLPSWTGRWTVAVVDESGKKLLEDSFTYAGGPE